MSGVWDSRNPKELVFLHSDNRRICSSAFGYAQICSAIASQTSHIPGALSTIASEMEAT